MKLMAFRCVESSVPGRLVMLACLSVICAWADQVVMKDGDKITGSIIRKNGQELVLKSKNFGTVTIKWDDVEAVKTDQPVTVVLPGDRTVKAKIETLNDRIQVVSTGDPVMVTPAEILVLRDESEQRTYERLLHPGLLDLWAMTGSIGIAGTKGNAETSTLTTPINFVRVSNTSRTTAYFNSIRASAAIDGEDSETARAIRGGWGYSRNLTRRLFANAFNDYEYDKFQALDLRVVLGTGLGYQVWTAETGRFALVGGGAWNREKFSPAAREAFTRNSAEAYWGDDFTYKLNTRTSLVQGFRMFNNLSNSGEYRMNFDISAVTQLTKWLNWNISLSDRYLSNPAPGRKSNDFLYTTGIGFAFTR